MSTEEVHPIDVNDLDHEIETYELPVVDFEKTLGGMFFEERKIASSL